MPELPEVETIRKGLDRALQDFRINRVEVITERTIASQGGAKVFVYQMNGLSIGEWTRRGKYLICNLFSESKNISAGWWVIHLRMTGQFQLYESTTPACNYTRVRLWNIKGRELRFIDTRNFGQMWWLGSQNLPESTIKGIIKLGPEPFSKEFNSTYLEESLKNRKRSIKASLLDQTTVAGAGNIYADESLFEAGITPFKQSKQLKKKEISNLCITLTRVLKKSIGKGGTTFKDFRDLEGINGNYGGQAWVYGRAGKACRKCGAIILKEKLCGRGTHWCPNCQK